MRRSSDTRPEMYLQVCNSQATPKINSPGSSRGGRQIATVRVRLMVRLDDSIRTFPLVACSPTLTIDTKPHRASHCTLAPYDMKFVLSLAVRTPLMAGRSTIGRAPAMPEETRTGPQTLVPANDNEELANPDGRPENTAVARLDRVVLDIARLIGRQMAGEAFEAGSAANDNRPGHQEGEGREPDGKPLGNRGEELPP